MPHHHAADIGILILAAGHGRRFKAAGGEGLKLMARYPEPQADQWAKHQTANQEQVEYRPLLYWTLQQALRSGLPVHLVTRPGLKPLQHLAQALKISMTLIDSQGSGESIAAGVQATLAWSGWLIQPGDMPWVQAADYRQVATALHSGAAQARLMYQGKPGHPVGFDRRYQEALSQLQGDQGARALLETSQLETLEAHRGTITDADLPPPDFSTAQYPP
ncbi:hypothetical protein BFW38_11645 [Terasakiispira papahanaumokuakeensis]|uniref:MobA-like NTP transferase domain-containing protein n=1 Tax=Terasakiispira papahanaumokuakeensis TaxID=197479 RepID=A0A1E2VAS1_9GAMM|nr:NTP transferase domain-containing protein [Terasakiispira papahanaumokuakeensis]ODC04087.1 hypothetical protein BFW38_11645 [Terasakiispira papahanaumokuakeensis]